MTDPSVCIVTVIIIIIIILQCHLEREYYKYIYNIIYTLDMTAKSITQ